VLSSPPASCSMRWSACVAVPPHQWQGGLPSRMAALFVRYCWVVFLLPAMTVMLLAPLLRCGCFQCYISLVVCASPHFERVALAGGLFRTVSQSPFVSLGNAALATYPNNLSRKSSWVVGRASSTHVSVCYANTVQSRMWPWSYAVVRGCYLRKPWIMAMPSDSSRTYQATISMMINAVL
jgi:hypothetical protein